MSALVPEAVVSAVADSIELRMTLTEVQPSSFILDGEFIDMSDMVNLVYEVRDGGVVYGTTITAKRSFLATYPEIRIHYQRQAVRQLAVTIIDRRAS
jgi:hypothetical protein